MTKRLIQIEKKKSLKNLKSPNGSLWSFSKNVMNSSQWIWQINNFKTVSLNIINILKLFFKNEKIWETFTLKCDIIKTRFLNNLMYREQSWIYDLLGEFISIKLFYD